ncbi:MAG: PTS glucose transporter subunit IIA [Succinivibrionaceae bacterium]|nr:PTS glucose transporter subunit IIA [Succinivibrionaceae bacterium]
MFSFLSKFGRDETIEIASPLSGKLIEASAIPDEAFANGILGPCVGILPPEDNNVVLAPAAGTITQIAATKHCVIITTHDDAVVMVHIGLDTVDLKGEGFTYMLKEGDQVTRGEPILSFDGKLIKSRGFDLTCPLVIVNADGFRTVEFVSQELIEPLDPICVLKRR